MIFNRLPKVVIYTVVFSFLIQLGCDGNKFDTLPNDKCFEANNTPGLSGEFTSEGTCIYKHDIRVGKVDILFVIDNSRSMYKDQQKMANRFPTFIESIWNMDFQIAIMTTDVTKEPVRSGQFVTLSNGKKVLNNNVMSKSEITQVFSSSVTRQETLSCELSSNNCPSSDVRGIYAANLAMSRNQSFFRPDAHTAIVILSDADERVFGGTRAGYELDSNWDTPSSLVRSLSRLGASKTLSVHSIIINPGHATLPDYLKNTYELKKDINCYNEQRSQGDGVLGFYARRYYELSVPSDALKASGNLLKGTVGSICSNDYGRELSEVSVNVKNNIKTVGLRCEPLRLDVYETGKPENKVAYTLISSNQVKLEGNIPVGLRITVEAECHNVH